KNLRVNYRITHFYFHDASKVCFLRVHNPTRFGDFIDRFTMADAAKKKEPAHGIELGPYGTFALRLVVPWLINGELAGYLELGEEISHLTPRLSRVLGVELVLTIDKKNLDRSGWEEGLKMMGRSGNWDQFSNSLIIDKTTVINSPKINDYMKLSHSGHAGILFDVKSDNRHYRSGMVQLIDAGGNHVGDVIVMQEITVDLLEMKKLTSILVLANLIIGGFLFVFFYIYVKSIEISLSKNHNELQEVISELKIALTEVKNLSGLLPICASCKKIRDDKGYWNQIEEYIMNHSKANFTHSICPECKNELYPEYCKGKNNNS
ncbi:MAG: hypothetical protein GY868_12445, partial [Deltaproteobacteria bacterium]|nr:hypothetical protein [Deltaproteobacteria bacterium]